MADELDPKDVPWVFLPERVCRALWAAGLTDPDDIAQMQTRQLLQLPDIGEASCRAIRRVWSAPQVRDREAHKAVIPTSGGKILPAQGHTAELRHAIKDEVRRKATVEFGKRIDRLAAIADNRVGPDICKHCGRGGEAVTISEQIRAIGELGKYGPGTQHDLSRTLDFEHAKQFVSAIAGVVAKHVPDIEVQKAIVEDFKGVIREFFPRR